MLRNKLIIPVLLGALILGLAVGPLSTALAQDTTDPVTTMIADRGGNGMGILACTTTTPLSVVAKALGLSDIDLRKALVSGKTVEQLAQEKGVDAATIQTALQTYISDAVKQAVADGLLTEAQATAITNNQNRFGNMFNKGMGRQFMGAHNAVQNYVVAAQALGMTCPELIKATQNGTTIAAVAQQKGKDAQTVIDALVAAHKAALEADVKDGLITQLQADGRLTHLTTQITQFVNAGQCGMGNMRGHMGNMGNMRGHMGNMSNMCGGHMGNMGNMRGGRMGDRNGGMKGSDNGGMQGNRGNRGGNNSNAQSTPEATAAAQ